MFSWQSWNFQDSKVALTCVPSRLLDRSIYASICSGHSGPQPGPSHISYSYTEQDAQETFEVPGIHLSRGSCSSASIKYYNGPTWLTTLSSHAQILLTLQALKFPEKCLYLSFTLQLWLKCCLNGSSAKATCNTISNAITVTGHQTNSMHLLSLLCPQFSSRV